MQSGALALVRKLKLHIYNSPLSTLSNKFNEYLGIDMIVKHQLYISGQGTRVRRD